MNKENEIQKLNKLKNLIERTSNKNLREHLIDNYLDFRSYLIAIDEKEKCYSNESDELKERIRMSANKLTENIISFFDNNFNFLNELTNKYSELHQKYPLNLYLGCEENRKIPYKDLNNIIESFIKSLGDDVYNIFINMIKNENITISKEEHLRFSGACYNLAFYDNPRMIVKYDNNSFYMAQTLAHEMGHFYEFVRNKTNEIKNSYNLFKEVPSLIFEKMFSLYLIENGYYKNDGMDIAMISKNIYIKMNMVNKIINQACLQNAILLNPSIIGNLEIQTKFWKKIDYETQSLIKTYGTNMNNYKYIIADVITSNLLSKYINNKQEGLKEIKDFITTMYQYSVSENIEKYALDMTNTEVEIRELYNYQKKKFYL